MPQNTPDFDVVIVGAGLSGIGSAYHLQDKCPQHSYTIFEARANMGGTWDLFRYPGIRSDSDMYTLGFSFYPWKDPKAIADGPAILSYIKETASVFGIDQNIQFQRQVSEAHWDSQKQQWLLQVTALDQQETLSVTCNFLFMCSGYYDYAEPYNPPIAGAENFKGQLIHPQHWPEGLDYTGQEVVVIGSGATAVTLVPEMAKKAKGVTMLQRTPSYIMNLPSEDAMANFLKRILPAQIAHSLNRWKNILQGMLFYQVSRRWPGMIKKLLKKGIRKALGSAYQERNFDPPYQPWDQRLCLIPDEDLFQVLKEGKAKIITDTIDHIQETGLQLHSGKYLPADLIVKATGLKVQLFGGMKVFVEGQLLDTAKTHTYKGVLFGGVPNLAVAVGYTNATWTLKCDLNGQFVCKMLNHMQKNGFQSCTPRFDPTIFDTEALLDFDAGYIKRAAAILPKQGSKAPWKVYQNYIKDLASLKYGSVKDRYLEYQ